jgi:hypothetical protein
MTVFGVLIFDGGEELAFVGPWELLTASAMLQEQAAVPVDVTVVRNAGAAAILNTPPPC